MKMRILPFKNDDFCRRRASWWTTAATRQRVGRALLQKQSPSQCDSAWNPHHNVIHRSLLHGGAELMREPHGRIPWQNLIAEATLTTMFAVCSRRRRDGGGQFGV